MVRGQGGSDRRGSRRLGECGIALDDCRLGSGPGRGLDVALSRFDPSEEDHEKGDQQQHRQNDDQFGEGLAFVVPTRSGSVRYPLARNFWTGSTLVSDTCRLNQGMITGPVR